MSILAMSFMSFGKWCREQKIIEIHRIIIDLMFVVYEKMGIQIDNASWSAVGFALISVCVAIVILTPIKCLVLKYIPWCLGKKKG